MERVFSPNYLSDKTVSANNKKERGWQQWEQCPVKMAWESVRNILKACHTAAQGQENNTDAWTITEFGRIFAYEFVRLRNNGDNQAIVWKTTAGDQMREYHHAMTVHYRISQDNKLVPLMMLQRPSRNHSTARLVSFYDSNWHFLSKSKDSRKQWKTLIGKRTYLDQEFTQKGMAGVSLHFFIIARHILAYFVEASKQSGELLKKMGMEDFRKVAASPILEGASLGYIFDYQEYSDNQIQMTYRRMRLGDMVENGLFLNKNIENVVEIDIECNRVWMMGKPPNNCTLQHCQELWTAVLGTVSNMEWQEFVSSPGNAALNRLQIFSAPIEDQNGLIAAAAIDDVRSRKVQSRVYLQKNIPLSEGYWKIVMYRRSKFFLEYLPQIEHENKEAIIRRHHKIMTLCQTDLTDMSFVL